jgi:hypothetical protein
VSGANLNSGFSRQTSDPLASRGERSEDEQVAGYSAHVLMEGRVLHSSTADSGDRSYPRLTGSRTTRMQNGSPLVR